VESRLHKGAENQEITYHENSGFIHSTGSCPHSAENKRVRVVVGSWNHPLIFSTIFPRRCGAPASISCAARACSSGRTVPTWVASFPLSKSSEIAFRRAVVTSTSKYAALTPWRVSAASGTRETTETRIPPGFRTLRERSCVSPPTVSPWDVCFPVDSFRCKLN
jgi:hypothetical protein